MTMGISYRGLGRSRAQILSLSILGLANAAINNDASPYEIKFNDTASVGPDGPWNYILIADPDNGQYIAALPSVARIPLYVNATACEMQGSTCPPPKDQTWHQYDAWENANGPDTKSFLMPPEDWDADYTALLNLTGAGGYFVDQIVLHNDGNLDSPAHLDNQALAVSKDWTVNLGVEMQYTRSVSLLSLNASISNITYYKTQDETTTANTTLYSAYDAGYIPSLSYGLHIGSAEPNITGSLVLGGYDKSRILSDAIVAGNDNLFRLTDIALNVSSGGSAFIKSSSSGAIEGLLKASTDFGDYIPVHPRPGVPYLYLPLETCDAIAEHLPVTYSPYYNLYMWDTDKPAYEDIVSSPHYLSFVFTDDTKTEAHIKVPFALLNLTLDKPVSKEPKQYFPCSPWETETTGYTLGNAFLQAAFLSQHWQMNTTVLAQAPGPDYDDKDITLIPHDSDISVGAAIPAKYWAKTWSNTLKDLPGGKSSGTTSSSTASSSSTSTSTSNSDSSGTAAASGNNGNDPTSEDKKDSVSGGAIAGIVVGVVGGLALIGAALFFFLRRKKGAANKQHRLSSTGVSLQNQSPPSRHAELDAYSAAGEAKPAYEVESRQLAYEAESRPLTELPTQQRRFELPGDSLLAEKPAN